MVTAVSFVGFGAAVGFPISDKHEQTEENR